MCPDLGLRSLQYCVEGIQLFGSGIIMGVVGFSLPPSGAING